LNTLIDPQSGWQLLGGFGINDNHEVVGYGYHNGSDNNHLRAYKLKLPDLSPCPPADSCHLPTTRDLLTGVCPNPTPKPDGTACEDGSSCTGPDICQAGVCNSGAVVNPACLPAPWFAAAKQAGLLPSGYLTPTIYEPIGDPANIDITDPH